jgi:hypothetical protein
MIERVVTPLEQKFIEDFPELRAQVERNSGSPYLLMNDLAEWLAGLPEQTNSVSHRVRSFLAWCRKQPRSDDAAIDVSTIVHIGFFEKLFRSPSSRRWLPPLLPRQEIESHPDDWKRWVGAEQYQKALELYNDTI